jgi:hypothetical protein
MSPYIQYFTTRKGGAVIHVNRQHIAMNAKDGGNRPVYTIKPNGPNSKPIYAREVEITGPSKLVYNGKQLSCGARAWIEVPAGVLINLIDGMTYDDAKEAI